MAIKIAREVGPFFSFVDCMSCITVAKRPCLLKINMSYNIVCYCVYIWFVYSGDPPTAMNAVLAISPNGGRVIIEVGREAVQINHLLLLVIDSSNFL